VSPVRYELGFSIPEDGVLHSHRRENLTFYKVNVTLAQNAPGIHNNFCNVIRYISNCKCVFARWHYHNDNTIQQVHKSHTLYTYLMHTITHITQNNTTKNTQSQDRKNN
jgi:hypothetical protein